MQHLMKTILFLLLLQAVVAAPSYGFGLSASTTVASTTANYIFGISLTGDPSNIINIQSGASSTIQFPSDYTGRLTSGAATCTVLSWGDPFATILPTPTCSISGTSVTITNLFTSAYTINYSFDFAIQVSSIKNPMASGQTGSFYYYLYASAGTIIITATGVGISTSTMTCSVAPTPTAVNSNGSLSVQFLTPEFQTTSTIQIDFGRYWPEANPKTLVIMPTPSSVTCSPGTNAGTSISCSFSSIGTSTYSGTVSSIVSSNLASTAVTFSFGSVLTPPTTKAQGSFLIIAKEGSKTMSQCTASVNGMTPGSLTSGALSAVTTIVNTATDLSVSFVVNVNVVSSDVVQVTFPSGIPTATISQVYLPALGTFVAPTISGQVVNVTGAVCASGATLTLTFGQITNPSSELATGTFGAKTFRGGFQMDGLSGSITYSATRASISSATLSASSLQIGTSATYTVQFTLGQPLNSASAIVVGLPTSFQGKVGGCSPSPCSVSTSSVTFTSPSSTTPGSSLSLSLTSVTNPLSIGPTTSLTLSTLFTSTQPTSIVQYTNTGLTVDLVARVIPTSNIVISSTSQVVSYFPASFTIAITNVNALPANTGLEVVVPAEIGVSVNQVNCQVGSSAISCTYNAATKKITFSALSSASIAAGALVSTPVVINNLINPSSTSPTSSFGVYLTNTLSQVLQYQATGLTFTSNQAASFFSLTLIPNNTVNSAATSLSLKFSITASTYTNSSLLVVTFPALINIQQTTCTAVSATLASVSCSVNGQDLQAILVYTSASTSTATEFAISGYKNYPSLEGYTLQVELFADLFKNSKLCTNSHALANLKNMAVGSITLGTYSFSSTILLAATNLNFQIVSTDGASFSSLKMTFPSQFSIAAATCSLPSGLSYTISGSTISITSSTSFSLPLIGTVSGLTAPSFSPSSNLYIQTFSSTNYLMDSNTQIYFSTACTLPCRTCPSSATTCASCYTNTSLVSGKIYLNSSACVSVCASGLYLDTPTNSCLLCVAPCATCASSTVCYTCNSTTSFLSGSCLSSCPFGYYSFNSLCLVCSSAIFCQSCPNSYSCSTCISGYYLYNANCYLSCPAYITYPNAVNKTCDACPSNCSTCTGNSSSVVCSACLPGYVLDNSRCYSTCISNGLIAVAGVCQGCTSPCDTCSGLVTNCTSCLSTSSAPYLFGNRCLSVCPNGYYPDVSTYSCLACSAPCQLCANVSIHSCSSCLSGYYLYLNDCLATCPSTFYSSSGKCISCVSPCLTCSGYSTCLSCTNSTYLYNSQCLSQCPGGMAVVNGNQCLVCLSTCKTCTSTSFCDSCFTNTYLYNGTCISICPSLTFPNATTLTCQTCQPPCLTCLNNSYCLTCSDTTKFQVSGACISCTSPCNSCSGSVTNCTSCITTTLTPYIFNFNCLVTCPNGYYSDSVAFSCSPCVSPCLECTGATNSSCSSCVANYYLLLNLCLAVCPAGYYPNVNACSNCVSPCQTCSSASVCLSCTNGTYLLGSSCVSSCGAGLTIISNAICSFCSSTCLTCLSSNISSCTSCYSGAYLDRTTQTCSSSCNTGFYPDTSSGTGLCVRCIAPCSFCSSATYCLSCLDSALFLVNGSCLSCSSPCLTCSGLRSNCTACDTASANPYLYSGQCNSACLFGFYPSSSFICVACASPCASCTNGSSSGCLTCLTGYYKLGTECFTPCPSGYFANLTVCSACVAPCSTCSSSSVCLSCISGFFLLGSSCVNPCSAGMAVINGTTCEYCSSTCLTCLSSNSSACTSCHPTTYLSNRVCPSTCPTSTYADNSTSTCQPCLAPCSTCSALTFCLTCSDSALFLTNGSCLGCASPCITCAGLRTTCTSCAASTGFPYLLSSACLSSCPSDYYPQSSTGTCKLCQSPCLTCSALSTCLSCISNYLLHLGSCLQSCPSSYYSNNITCLACSSPCQNCQDATVCTTCQGGLLLQGSTCVATCSSGLIAVNSTVCSYCSSTCASCISANVSACTSCYSGFYLLGSLCGVTCVSGYYPDSGSGRCLLCQHPCGSCSALAVCLSCVDSALFLVGGSCVGCLSPCLTCSTVRTNCTSCDTSTVNKYLVGNNCLSVCPSGTYANGLSCTACTSPCDSCLNSSTSSCLTCIPSYHHLGNTCLSVCPTGYYTDSINCIACVSPCLTCSSASICLSCIAGQYLLGSSCYSTCPGGMVSTTVGNNSVCQYCAASCLTCLSVNSSYCTSCNTGNYLQLGACVVTCSSGFFPNAATGKCQACISPCATCSDATTCKSCLFADYFLISGKCLGCASPCLSCSSGITTCASCNTTSSYPYFYQSNCLAACPSTFYPSASFLCTQCSSPCSTCSGAGNQSCLTCLTGYLRLNSECYVTCPGGYYNHSNLCLACTSPCLLCVGPGTAACLSCTSGLFLLGSVCVNNCSGLAVNGSSCVYCQSSCLTCQTNNNTHCTSCSGLYLYNGQCLTSCGSGFYPDSTLAACMPCLSPCGTCTSSSTCLSCIDATKFLINSTCVGCSSPCRTCSASTTNCTSCDPLSGLPLFLNFNCISSCPSGYYQNGYTCLACTTPCSTCSGTGTQSCLTCLANTYLLGTTCYSTCPIGYYSSVSACLACTSPCSSCQTTASTCLSCISAYYLRGSSCVSNCSTGEVVVNNTYCQVCSNNCLTCLSTNFSYCTSCSTGTYLSLGQCLSTCPNLTYPDSTLQCLSCVYPCLSCSSLTVCTTCQTSLFLVGTTCSSCVAPCLTCSVSQNNCTSCNTSSSNPYYLLNGCLASCPAGYYPSGSFTCLACLSPCSTCSAGTTSSCLTCLPGYSQLSTNCYLTCPSSYYTNGTTCLSCNSTLCQTCTLSSTTCTACVSPLYLHGSSCVVSCPLGMTVFNNSICQSCSGSCLTCLSSNTSYCTTCQTTLYLFAGTCVSTCPDYFFRDAGSSSCLGCVAPCSKCTSISACTSCVNPLHFIENFACVSNCTYPLVGINGTCYQCSSQCLTCIQTVSTCLLCAANFYYFPANLTCSLICSYYILAANLSTSNNNECTVTCPAATYPSSPNCLACPTGCSLCLNASFCSQCISTYYFYSNFCYNPCPAAAPYPIGANCIMCNISLCLVCQNTTHCRTCNDTYLLIQESNTSSCISACPTGQEYNSTHYLCQDIPVTVAATNIVESAIPPYSIIAGAAALTFVLFLVKFKFPQSQLVVLMFIMLNLANTIAMANLIVVEISNNGLANITASTAVLVTAAGVQVLSSVGALIAIIKIKDPQIVGLFVEHPLSCMLIAVLSVVDANFMLITSTQMLGFEVFQAKLTGQGIVKVMKFTLCSSLLVKLLTIGYSAMQLLYYSKQAYRMLQVANFPIENSATIQMLVLSGVALIFVCYLLCKLSSDNSQKQTKQQQSHASLMDQANAYDKRNESNAQIMMSVDNSDMIVDINSLKDQKEISEGENKHLYFEESGEESSKSTKRLKNKKVTPDDMLRRMQGGIEEEEKQGDDEEESRKNSQEDEKIEVNLTTGDVFFVQPQQQEQVNEKDNNQEETANKKASVTEQVPEQQPSKIDNNESRGDVVLVQQNSVELFDTSHSKIADISEIVHKDNPIERSNIFDSELQEQDDKNKTEVLNFDKPDNDKIEEEPKYSPSQLSKYQPDPKINNEFAHNSYMDDAYKFNEHQFQKQINQPQKITFEEVNKDFEEETPNEISFRKKGNFVEPTVQKVQERYNKIQDRQNKIQDRQNKMKERQNKMKERQTKEEVQRRQEQEIAKILEGNSQMPQIMQIEQQDQYRQTPVQTPTRTPHRQTFVEDLDDDTEDMNFRPSEGLRGNRRRDHRRKPDIPLPKNQTQKSIINVYGKKNLSQPKKRYEMPPKQSSKRGNYLQYQMEDNEFTEDKYKPIFSGEIAKNAQSRYKRSLDLGNASIEQEMPAKPSLHLRKSSFKKIGEMILDSESSARK